MHRKFIGNKVHTDKKRLTQNEACSGRAEAVVRLQGVGWRPRTGHSRQVRLERKLFMDLILTRSVLSDVTLRCYAQKISIMFALPTLTWILLKLLLLLLLLFNTC